MTHSVAPRLLVDQADTVAQLDTTATIARLSNELEQARERARVAEEQLERVHRAVRAFKLRQIELRKQSAAAQSANTETANPTAGPIEATSLERAAPEGSKPETAAPAWADADPSLDDRFAEYLDASMEPDKSRRWILGS